MARITIKIKRVTSLFKFLKYGRGLSNYTGGMDVILRVSGGSQDALFGTLPLMRGGSDVSIDIPPDYYGNRIIVHGSEPDRGNLLFQLETTYIINDQGEWIVEPLFWENNPTRHVRKLTVAFVDDWTEALRRLQQELEADEEDHRDLLDRIEALQLESFDRAFWERLLSLPASDWVSVEALEAVSNIVDCDRINARVTLQRELLNVDLDMRKSNGRRFGRARFGFRTFFEQYSTPVTLEYGLDVSTWQRRGAWRVEPLDIRYSRPGLNAINARDKARLDEVFLDYYGRHIINEASIVWGRGSDRIQELWPVLRELAPIGRRRLLPDALTFYRRGLATRVRQRVAYPGTGTAWGSVSCYRPQHAGAIEALVTDPGKHVVLPPDGTRK